MTEPTNVQLVLHAHLPYVRHTTPGDEDKLEHRWFYDALIEVYLPLIEMLKGWSDDNIPAALSLVVTPTLAYMLQDELLADRFEEYLNARLERAEQEVDRTKGHLYFHRIAYFHRARLYWTRSTYRRLRGNIISALVSLEEKGVVELIGCAATHAFLPHLRQQPGLLKLQIEVGVKAFIQHFGRPPSGFWLPECGYSPEIGQQLADVGILLSFVEADGFYRADPSAVYGVRRPVVSPAGPILYAREPEISALIWSREQGYPGDPRYREYHRDIGYEDGSMPAWPTGFKYYRVTDRQGALSDKQPYDRTLAREALKEHVDKFGLAIENWSQAQAVEEQVITLPFDAELFGHWWFEGLDFLDGLVRKHASRFRFTTPSAYLAKMPNLQVSEPSESSWGTGGFGEVWLNPKVEWVWPRLHEAGDRLSEAVHQSHPRAVEMAKELLLASSSDWLFQITQNTAPHYAKARIETHLENCTRLEKGFEPSESLSSLFPFMDMSLLSRCLCG